MFFNTYNKFFLGICSTAPLTDEACCQIYHAAMSSGATPSSAGESFTPGVPYEFSSKSRVQVRAERLAAGLSEAQASPCWIEPHGMLAVGQDTPRRGPAMPSIIGPCGKADMGYMQDVECCGNERCGKASSKLRCGRCQDQLYCNKTCQSKDWARHKVVCRTPEMRKDIDEKPEKWTNIFDLLPGRI